MSVSEATATIRNLVGGIRAQIAEVDNQITTLEIERNRLRQLAPHTDDIIAVYKRGLDASTAAYRHQLRSHLAAKFGVATAFAEDRMVDPRAQIDVLTIPSKQLDTSAMTSWDAAARARNQPIEINTAALSYFLHDRIEQEIPALVDELHPEARHGTHRADRDAALRKVEQEIAALRTKRTELNAALGDTRRAVAGEL
ncbi:hypothetical protein M9979_13950 [Sphingomonas sp. RP10(2022)]|uniref:Uncharacterized protein n=1 Tax=Sphingomonas liriopis TaxID=2949094 RepID=A0A9X2KRE6_9SPHN|nr:hypothetical protein [Sphingomonas liriopis]MCP3735972.1 hypothetical protein [Sphingomonas liriopis]